MANHASTQDIHDDQGCAFRAHEVRAVVGDSDCSEAVIDRQLHPSTAPNRARCPEDQVIWRQAKGKPQRLIVSKSGMFTANCDSLVSDQIGQRAEYKWVPNAG